MARADLYRLGTMLADSVLPITASAWTMAFGITIDLDATDDPNHGQQELAFSSQRRLEPSRPLLRALTNNPG